MEPQAHVEILTQPLDEKLVSAIESIGNRTPRNHGNYIPALDKALEIMTADAPNRGSVLLLPFSDGAPSDQRLMQCEHGIEIFSIDRKQDPKMGHRSAGSAWDCRRKLQQAGMPGPTRDAATFAASLLTPRARPVARPARQDGHAARLGVRADDGEL